MDIKVESTVSTGDKSPGVSTMALSTKEMDRTKAFKILEGVFPLVEYSAAATALSYASGNASTITIGTLIDAIISHTSDDIYSNRLIGILSMEGMAVYDDLEYLIKEARATFRMRRRTSQPLSETYHMHSCYCKMGEEQ